MCFDLDSLPPVPALRGAAVTHERMELTAADGNRFAAFEAKPEQPGAAAVVILPDVRGLYRFYEELALRFAERGIGALAFDYFGRTAGVTERGDDFEYMPHVQQTAVESIQADAAAAIAELRGRTGVERVAAVGFCFGGRQAFLAGTSAELGLDRVVGFYGSLGERRGMPEPRREAANMRVPVLGLFGGADQAIPQEDVDEFDRNLDAAGVEHEIVVYPGAPHSFFDRKYDEWAQASADAWRRTLAFLQE
jgi:carboxymethylenebutenolidase